MVKWIALVLVLVPVSAAAGFVSKKSDWDDLSDSAKAGYVMGLLDYQFMVDALDDEANKYNDDIRQCIFDLELTSGTIVDLINKGYETLEKWEQPPIPVYFSGIRKVCLKHMNRARAARGDELLEP